MKTSKILVNLMCIGSILAKVASLPAFAGGIGYETEYPLEILSSDYYDQEVDWNLWDKFLKYDLCITDYDALTAEEQELCKFIFETERSATGTIRCERARRTLAGDTDLGERMAVEELDGLYGVYDKYSHHSMHTAYCFNTHYIEYRHCVPDIIHLDYKINVNEYWTNDSGTIRILDGGTNYTNYSTYCVLKFDDTSDEWSDAVINKPDFVDDREIVVYDGINYAIHKNGVATVAETETVEQEVVTIRKEIDGIPVVGIDPMAFRFTNITEVILPDTITHIGGFAFGECQYLERINIPSSLEFIGEYAFNATTALTSIEIDCPDLFLPSDLFRGSGIVSADLNVKTIGENSFRVATKLENVTFGEQVENIRANAFWFCSSLASIEIPVSICSISQSAFVETLVDEITIPETLEVLGAIPEAVGTHNYSFEDGYATDPLVEEWTLIADENLAINGWYNTEAHRYALEWGLKFNPMDEDVTYGDTNLDGEISMADMVLLQSYLKGNISEIGYEADLMEDGIIDAFDMIRMRRSVLAYR